MPKREPHPLDKLFKAALRSISMQQFELRRKELAAVPTSWRWPDPQTGREWTLMGRKGELLWQASEAHFVKNHSLALFAVQEAIRHDEAWHESKPGVPDILLFWLGTMRYGTPHARTQDMIARALRDRSPGDGTPGDGGWLDQVFSIVEHELDGDVSEQRKRVIHNTVGRPWLLGNLLRGINPVAGDWRPVSTTTLPVMWPLETIRRAFHLAQRTQTQDASLLTQERDGQSLVEQLRRFPPDQAMMDMLVADAIGASSRGLPLGTLCAIEHYHSQGLPLPEAFSTQFSPRLTEAGMLKFPAIQSSLQRFSLDEGTPEHKASRTSPRL